jgi:hypothetical protein
MNKTEALTILIDANVRDYVQALGDEDFKESVARYGFKGFMHLDVLSNAKNAVENGLDEFDNEVAEALADLSDKL